MVVEEHAFPTEESGIVDMNVFPRELENDTEDEPVVLDNLPASTEKD